MVNELPSETQVGAIGWAQDQLYQLKAQVAQLEQRIEQQQLISSTLGETSEQVERSLQAAINAAAQTPRLQEELNQTIALVMQLQDRHAEMKERVEHLSRSRGLEEERDTEEWAEAIKRVEQLERQVDHWKDRQGGVDESTRRQHEELSLLKQQVQQLDARLETSEGKSSKGLESSRSAEQKVAQLGAELERLSQQQEATTERARVNQAALKQLEATLDKNLNELKRLELLAERIELHRAERQRLEDRALRLEEELQSLSGRFDTGEQLQGKMNSQQQGLASRLDSLAEQVEEQRVLLIEQIRKLTATQDRTKRRQIQELERELRDMRKFVADITREEV
jgi:fused signal recognition particle receptor